MFFRKGHNCWEIAGAERIAFLIDGEDYFRAFAEACEAARKTIFIIGWDIDSRVSLRRDGRGRGEMLGKFIDRLARQKPELHIYILDWDFAMFYVFTREFLPVLSFGWNVHKRVHFALDDDHPLGASHHQKIVAIDDRLAFIGGMDLTSHRWDTADHALDNPRRNDNGSSYGPYHDVQMMVEGEAAAKLMYLARRRWERVTGDRFRKDDAHGEVLWPESVAPDLGNTEIAILRTMPEYEGDAEVREIENFYIDAIDRARLYIYIENQYLTSLRIGAALEKALGKKEGPEVLLVLPLKCSGWLEEGTIGALRGRLLDNLKKADRYGRLKICYPDRKGLESEFIRLHSKLYIADDEVATIGSANLNNRSMGFDTECNLALFAGGEKKTAEAIAGLRNRLLAEHLGSKPEIVAGCYRGKGSLLSVVEELNKGDRFLRELPDPEDSPFMETLPANMIVDPESPVGIAGLLDYFGFGTGRRDAKVDAKQKVLLFASLLVLTLVLVMIWRWSPLDLWLNVENLSAASNYIRESPFTIVIVLSIYVIGSCFLFPVTVMIVLTAFILGPFLGFALALGGSILGGLTGYAAGRRLGRDRVRKLASDRANRLSRRLVKHGWLSVALVRIVPIAPFTIVNLVAGSSRVPVSSFLIGTIAGMGPGIIAIIIFERGLQKAITDPNWWNWIMAAGALACGALILFLVKHWLVRLEMKNG
jgi:phosphatidylserine/phosphatidylglycerophosphate/cardiolipin synthase-like enzyme/uncharacterized membrane protein YdjX (TVP38/TMEM64 family)